jgi:hypothetical protein
MPPGLTRAALALAATCVVALGASYAIARPDAGPEPSVGTKPVPVSGEEATFKAPRLGSVEKVPALKHPPAPEPVPVVRVKKTPEPAAEPPPQPRPRPAEPTYSPPAPVAPQPQVVSPAPAPPVAAPAPAPSPPPPPPPEPAVSFDDSG